MYSSAWQKHKESKKKTGLCFGVGCFYCEAQAAAGESSARWIRHYPNGSYKNAGKRPRYGSPRALGAQGRRG